LQNNLSIFTKSPKDITYYQYKEGIRITKTNKTPTQTQKRIYLGDYEIYRIFDNSSNIQLERETIHLSDPSGRFAMQENLLLGSDTPPSSQ
jgi:hypothetical protein